MPVSRVIDPKTRDYVRVNGTHQTTRTVQTQVYLRLTVRRGSWWGDPELGQDLAGLMRDEGITAEAPADAEDRVRLALQPLIDAGRADEFEIRSTPIPLGASPFSRRSATCNTARSSAGRA